MVIDRYALYDPIASGGMGTVHLGRVLGSVGFTRTVAIKRLRSQYAANPSFVSSFVDEARLTARVRHPNVVPPLDVVATGGELFLVMEYVHGETASALARALASRGNERAPMRVVVSIMVGVLLGLHAAHDARNEEGEPLRIVHRDVSPQNIIIGADGHARVLDFGIAKATRRLNSTRKDDPSVKGKIAYLSPEQANGQPVDQRTDVHAASIVLWEMLTGRRLYSPDDPHATFRAIVEGRHAAPSAHASEVPRKLDAIVLRGLAANPNDRWPTARAMAIALEDCVPPATASQVGAWIGAAAGQMLATRAAAVAEMESEITTQRLSAVLGEISSTARPEPEPVASDEPTRRGPR